MRDFFVFAISFIFFIIFEFSSFHKKYSSKDLCHILSQSGRSMLNSLDMLSLNWRNFVQEAQFNFFCREIERKFSKKIFLSSKSSGQR